ncbi:MAG: hypothetical protein CVU80_00450 [Elusimicrobia bacterium HGW-Elusimicrobia-4]|nr:MAG: hypothetical protein CVU80_00450 [Elusimicrobia bacterium HGW-Elusimicrobia-4]
MNSLGTFKIRLKEIKNLKNIIQNVGEPIDEESREKISTLTRASMVMLCSHIEGYLEDLILEFVNELCTKGICANKIPELMKVKYMKKNIETYFTNPDLAKKLFLIHSKLWTDGITLQQGDIEGEQLITEFSNPDPKKVEKLLSNIGLQEIWNKISDGKLKYDLEMIVRYRHRIAHGDYEFTITDKDMVHYSASALKFVRQIYKFYCIYLKQVTSN